MELYLCSEECNNTPIPCYVIRCIKLTDLLSCSCGFDQESGKIINCERCVSKGQKRANYELQTRAWLRGKDIPISMGCCSSGSGSGSGSQIFFGGGNVLKPTSTGEIYRFETDSGVFDKYPVRFLNRKLDALLFQVNGDLYALAGHCIYHKLTLPSFEVHKLGSDTWEALPDPPFFHPKVFDHFYTGPKPGTKVSYAIVGTKILVSNKHDTRRKQEEYPVMCFDVAKGGKGDWTQVADSFFKSTSNKSLPFVGGALVLKWEGTTHVMFSYHEGFDIEACLLVENDDGSIKSSQHQFVGINSRLSHLMSANYYDSRLATAHPIDTPKSFGFVHLGENNICFINSMTIQTVGKRHVRLYQTARLLVIVFTYQVSNSGSLSFEFRATRIFEYQCLSPSIFFPKLIGCFVL